jgi:AhpD family alkylhydroperoxidase
MMATIRHESAAAKWKALDRTCKSLAVIRSAQVIGCPWCIDFGSFLSTDEGVTAEQLRDLHRWRESAVYTPEQRLCIEYAEAASRTPLEVTDELVTALTAALGEKAVVELAMMIALENERSRFNGALGLVSQGYSTEAGASLYGFGISSISSTPDTYRQNHKTLEEWRAALDRGELPIERGLRLTTEDQRRRTIIMRLMCDRRLDYAALSEMLGVNFRTAYAAEIASLADLDEDGLVWLTPTGIEVTPRGVPLLRVIAMRFDDTLVAAPRQHSGTI